VSPTHASPADDIHQLVWTVFASVASS
jgi:hypothetical protein